MDFQEAYLRQALDLAVQNVRDGGRPFGALLVGPGGVVATGVNGVLGTGDPTSHAEIEAVRAAARSTGRDRFDDHVMYASGHPCPMCLSAMLIAGIKTVYYRYSLEDGRPYGLSSEPIYAELKRFPATEQIEVSRVRLPDSPDVYRVWAESGGGPSTDLEVSE